MGIRESLLNTITSVGSSDFVRIVTSAGASSKATLQNVIKSFETGLGAKSSLTTSDYIRVVGSDNNLYKQSVSSMKSDMGISALEANDGTKIYNGTDLNTLALPADYKKIRVYYGEDITQMTNGPSAISSAWPFCLICLPIGGVYTKQILHMYGTTGTPNNEYIRTQSYISGSTAWTAWQQSPTRAEIEVLETTITGTTNQFGAINLNLPWRNYEIIAIASSGSNHWCIPTIVGASTYARVLIDGASWTPLANTSVSLTVRYRHYS